MSATHDSTITASFVAKAVAILAVVGLHVLSLFPDSIYLSHPLRLGFISLNQLFRFSVPLFLGLSGYGLVRKYGQEPVMSRRRFLWRRARKLVPLYVVWSVILFVSLYVSRSWSSGVDVGLVTGLVTGGVDYHLYFVPLLFQFYLLFALTWAIIRHHRWWLWLAIGSGLLQLGWLILLRHASIHQIDLITQFLNDQLQYRLIINWLFYFLVGMVLGQLRLDRWSGRRQRLLAATTTLTALLGLSWAIWDAHRLLAETGQVIYATGFTRPAIFVYAVSVIVGVIAYGHRLVISAQHLFSRAISILQTVGRYSYVIYLSHTLVLRILEGLITTGPRPITLARASILLLVGVAVSLVEMR